ncbi:glycosyltransferase family 4 protein [Rheinheimera sp. UJ63]|uniref:glycosyltransferase family 4 protein n=1 Tax=Rheinheimera sp. UJ63 TaxID=2910157 RepID=UPI001F44BEEA|nr:glycosyltransferase family 4 protein [Rheinheimera sp. UJ63]MCF4009287.1 glycosyltransferase family 4 protein [Rheinheimera sp. UJ63]
MRFALLPDAYLPSSTLVHAKMFHELAHELQKNGHQVVIITPGEPEQQLKLIIDVYDGVEVWRFRTGRTRGIGKVKRAINESLLPINAWLAIKSKVKKQPFDACINYSPTIFFGPLAKRLKAHGAYVYLILRDMFPQWVIDQGMIKEGSLITRYFRYFERLNYRASDCIGVMSEANLKLFNQLHPGYSNVKILMNWADTRPLERESVGTDWRKAWGLADKIVFFYGGNIGHAQDMANLMRLAKSMINMPEAHFLFVGQGDEVSLIHQLKEEWQLSNVTIKPSVSQQVYRELLTQTDIGLFSLSAKHTAHNFPGKLLGYMVESLPILGSVNRGNDVIELINQHKAGFVFENGDDEAFFLAAQKLLSSTELRANTGIAARQLLQKYFSVESVAGQIIEQVTLGENS